MRIGQPGYAVARCAVLLQGGLAKRSKLDQDQALTEGVLLSNIPAFSFLRRFIGILAALLWRYGEVIGFSEDQGPHPPGNSRRFQRTCCF